MEPRYISPIAIDLGAKYTGVQCSHYVPGEDLTSTQPIGAVIVTSDQLTLSQAPRTVKRHQRRGKQRYKLARRLLLLILSEVAGIKVMGLPSPHRDFILGLLRRRGFSYFLDEETNEAVLAEAGPDYFSAIYPSFINNHDPLPEQMGRLLGDIDNARQVAALSAFSLDKRAFQSSLPEEYREDKDVLWSAQQEIVKQIGGFLKAKEDGHLHRREYFKNIREDILGYADLVSLLKGSGLEPEKFANLVGNISNLQLRVLRKYFNEPSMAKGDYWDADRFSKYFWRWVKSWRAEPGTVEKENWHVLMAKRKQPALEILLDTDPSLSIPPYEDQDNRRPPKCLSLRFNISSLEKHFPNWADMTETLSLAYKDIDLGEGLDSRLPSEAAQILMRILDCSKAHDIYELRYLANNYGNSGGKRYLDALTKLTRVLGEDSEAFLKLAKAYYGESALARSGAWFEGVGLLEVCNSSPPRKAKMRTSLVRQILGSSVSEEQATHFIATVWNSKARIAGRSLKGWCKVAAQLQKDFGVNMKSEYNILSGEIKKTGQKPNKDKMILMAVFDQASVVAKHIAVELGIPVENAARFSSPYSLAQLFNLLEIEPRGFSRSCQACTRENLWRMTMRPAGDAGEAAHCSRLTVDSGRPFDGMIDRLSSTIAVRIAKLKSEQLSNVAEGSAIHIPILLEENRFEFIEELYQVKRGQGIKIAKKKRDFAEKKSKEVRERFYDKATRIKIASSDVCPYTGKPIGNRGEIDHIIPRSFSRDVQGAIYNHEANLIYCTSKGNNEKGDNIYTLDNLHPNYLQEQFGSSSVNDIENQILKGLERIGDPSKKPFFAFNENERKILRHALFLPAKRNDMLAVLSQQTKTRVNGTQAWLAKRIIRRLKDHPLVKKNNLKLTYSVHFVSPDLVAQERALLVDIMPDAIKADIQGVASHAVDAAMVLSAALDQPHTATVLKTVCSESFESPDWRRLLIPPKLEVDTAEPRPKYRKSDLGSVQIFKDGIYGESFLPIIVTSEAFYFGFSRANAVVLESDQAIYDLLSPFIERHGDPAPKSLAEARELIKVTSKNEIIYTINRCKAFEHLEKVAKKACTPEDMLLADILDSIRYCTQKTDVRAALHKGTGFSDRRTIMASKYFTLKVCSPRFSKASEIAGYSGSVTLPVKEEWEKLVAIPVISQRLGTKESWDAEVQNSVREHFLVASSDWRRHRRVRKTFSLPRLKNPSGGFRVKRGSHDGGSLWQVIEVEGAASAGFAKRSDGTVDFSQPVMISELARSDALVPLEGRYSASVSDIAYNDEWVAVSGDPAKPYSDIQLSINSVGRMRVRLTFDEAPFLRFLNRDLGLAIDSRFHLSSELKLSDGQKKSWGDWVGPLAGVPRSNPRVTQLGGGITVDYIVTGTNSIMKEAYNAAL